jgi:P-type conjugative transfer protein TrbL
MGYMDGGLLNQVLGDFQGAISGTWGPELQTYLLPLLMSLVTLQFGLVAVEAAIARDIPLLLVNILLGILRIGIVIALFDNGTEWGNDLLTTGIIIPQQIMHTSPDAMTPSGVFTSGLNMMQVIFHAKAEGSWLSEIVQSFEFLVAGVAVMLCWVFASIIYFSTLLEGTLLVYGGALIIAFTPLNWTFDMLISWGRALLGITIKIALVLMTLALGTTLAAQWLTELNASAPTWTSNLWNLLIAVVESIALLFFVWKVPNRISGLTAGAAAFGFGEALMELAGQRAADAVMPGSGGGGSGNGGGGSNGGRGGGSGGGQSSGGGESWGSQAAHAAAVAGKALAQKVQAMLTK